MKNRIAILSLLVVCLGSARAAKVAPVPVIDWDEFRRRINTMVRDNNWKAVEHAVVRPLQDGSWPTNRGAMYYMLAEATMRQGHWDEALPNYQKAAKLSPGSSLMYWSSILRIAEAQITLGRLAAPEKSLAEVAQHAPFAVLRNEAQLDQGYLLMRLGRDSEAQRLFQDMIQATPYYRQDRRIAKVVAALMVRTGSPTQAVEFLTRARSAQAEAGEVGDPAEYLIEALAHRALGNFMLENRDLQRLLQVKGLQEGFKTEATYLMGESYQAQGLSAMARQILGPLRAKGVDPLLQGSAEYTLGLVALAEDNPDEAVARARSVLQLIPTQSREPQDMLLRGKAQSLVGMIALKKGNLREAKTYLEAAATVPWLSMEDRLRLIWLRVQDKEYNLAVQDSTEYLDRFQWGEQAGYALILRGISFQKDGNYDKAVADYTRFLDKFPTHPARQKAIYLLASAYEQAGKWQELVSHVGMLIRSAAPEVNEWQQWTLFTLAEALFELGNYTEALDYYRQVATRFPPGPLSPDIYESIAVSQAKLGQYDDALLSQKQALSFSQVYPNHDIIRYGVLNLSSLMFDQHNYAKALSYYETFLKHFPNDPLTPDVLYQSAFAYVRLNRMDEAFARWSEIIKDYPNSPYIAPSLLEIGRRKLQLGRVAEAEEAFEKLSQVAPDSPEAKDALLLLGKSLFNQGAFQQAAEHYREFMKRHPNDERAAEIGKLEEDALYQWALAKGNPDLFLSQYPHSQLAENLYWTIGVKEWEKKEYASALETFQKLAFEFPDGEKTKQALYLMGEMNFEQGNFKEAVAALESFLDSDNPDEKLLPRARFHKAVSLFKLNQTDKAAEAFEDFLRDNSNDPLARDARYNLILANQKSGRVQQALDACVAFLKAYPKAPEEDSLRLQMGQMYKSLGNQNSAIESFSAVHANSASAIEAYYSLGQLYQEMGNYPKAQAAYKRLIPLRPREADLRISGIALLGEVFESAGEYNQALKFYDEVARYGRNPDWVKAANTKIAAIKAQMKGGR